MITDDSYDPGAENNANSNKCPNLPLQRRQDLEDSIKLVPLTQPNSGFSKFNSPHLISTTKSDGKIVIMG